MKEKKVKRWHMANVGLMLYDVFVVNIAYFLALWLRFDATYSMMEMEYVYAYLKFVPIYTVICVVVFWMMRLYKSIWKFASYDELIRVSIATAITGVLHIILITVLFKRMPILYYFLGPLLQLMAILGMRFSYRFVLLERSRLSKVASKHIMLIGAGSAGQMLLNDIMRASEINGTVQCIIDDDKNKWGRYINGVPIVGGRDDILYNVQKYNIEQILIAIPSADSKDKKEILSICNETSCDLKVLPGMYQMVNGQVYVSQMKNVAVEDLLGREQIKVDMQEIFNQITGKTILVTGGGGSIGSELCRQIAAHNPGHLIIFDIYENNAYDIEQELRRQYTYLKLSVLIGSVRDKARVEQIFKLYKPQIVYHAAAHKHVPLMENSPCEAIKNNVFGTWNTAYMAMKYNTEKFVLVSTDKAVNPTNIMGASKRICEMIIQSFEYIRRNNMYNLLAKMEYETDDSENIITNSVTDFVAVRFGNVLGSNGSVIPLFKKQIEAGGPVTVTHPDIKGIL